MDTPEIYHELRNPKHAMNTIFAVELDMDSDYLY